jgi:formate-dependent nitrite reductase cytochrome c552 subunit
LCAVCHTTGAPLYNQPQVATQNGYDPSVVWNDYHHNVLFLRVQCENCHGPGSQHVLSGGDTRLINRIPDPKQTCWNCHVHAPNEKGNILVAPATDAQLALYSSSLGHSHTAGALIAGAGGFEYAGEDYSQGHTQPHTKIAATCVTCHLHRDPSSPTLDHSNLDPKIAACRSCHADANRVNSLDDWGYLQSRQQAVAKLLVQLGGADSTGAPDSNAGGGLLGNAADKTSSDYKRARWNYSLVLNDGSQGAHNYDYALELVLTSIAHAPAQKP